MPTNAETVGGRIRKVRGALSQDEFASRMAVHKETLGKYERNRRQPDSGFLVKLRDEFAVSIDWLLTGSGQMRRDEAPVKAAEPATVRSEPDEELMRAIGNGIDTVYREFGARLGPGDIARLAERVRVDVVNSGARTTDEKQVAMRVSLDQLRRELRHPAADAGKGSACS